jgi:hypothetical protein
LQEISEEAKKSKRKYDTGVRASVIKRNIEEDDESIDDNSSGGGTVLYCTVMNCAAV